MGIEINGHLHYFVLKQYNKQLKKTNALWEKLFWEFLGYVKL